MKNCITRRYYAAIQMTLKTPLCVGGEDSENTDKDIIRDGEGKPFIPGSSVAGAIRDFLELPKSVEGVMGFSQDNDGRMSPLYVYDMQFSENPVVTTRDFVTLDHDKIAKKQGKFDMEIIDSGAQTTLYLEGINRQLAEYPFEDLFARIADGFSSGDIRLGAKKNRGFGWMEVKAAKKCSFTASDLDKWIDFVPDWKKKIFTSPDAEDIGLGETSTDKCIDMSLPLKLQGGISIRVYSAIHGEADYSHITSDGKPVIPGSSWNGAIRERIYDILEELGADEKSRNTILKDWFGFVQDKDAHQSRIIYEESVIDGGVNMPVTRNRIDRFDQATVGTALYTERAQFGGTTKLHVRIRKKKNDSDRAIAGMLMLVFEDIRDGFVAVGGRTGIGRGVFKADGDIGISDNTFTREGCLKALCTWLTQTKGAA